MILTGRSSVRSRWASAFKAPLRPLRLLTSTVRACDESFYSYVCGLQPCPLGSYFLRSVRFSWLVLQHKHESRTRW